MNRQVGGVDLDDLTNRDQTVLPAEKRRIRYQLDRPEAEADQRGQLHNGYEEEAMKTGRSFDSRFCQLGLPNRRVQRKVLIHEWRLLAARVPDTIRAIGLSHHRVTSDVV